MNLSVLEEKLNSGAPIKKSPKLFNGCVEAVHSFMKDEEPATHLRMSQLGKPMVTQAMNKLLKERGKTAKEFPASLQSAFLIGHLMEAWILELGEQLGLWAVAEKQTELEYRGVKGHVDAIVELSDGSLSVLEIKTMSSTYYNQFKKLNGVCDERGYLTQACMYSKCTGLPVTWVCWNKAFGGFAVIPLDYDIDTILYRTDYIIDVLPSMKTAADILLLPTPKPVDELFRGEPTGNLIMSPNFRWEPYAPFFYKTAKGFNKSNKEVLYVLDYETPEKVEEKLVNYLR